MQMDTGSSTDFRWQAFSQGAGQIYPRISGRAISSRTTSSAWLKWPPAISLFISGMFMKAGQERRQGASQSPTWSPSSSSSAWRRISLISGEWVCICISSCTGIAQEGKSLPVERSFTRQTMQEGWFVFSWLWHRVGMRIPRLSAACKTVVPAATSVVC